MGKSMYQERMARNVGANVPDGGGYDTRPHRGVHEAKIRNVDAISAAIAVAEQPLRVVVNEQGGRRHHPAGVRQHEGAKDQGLTLVQF